MNIKKYGVYNTKVYDLNEFVEIQVSENNQCFLMQGEHERKTFKKIEFSSAEEEEEYKLECERKREVYYKEQARQVRRLVQANFNAGSKFATFTFDNNHNFKVEDLKKANQFFKEFISRLNKYLNKATNTKRTIKYIATWELTKKGRIHYHVIFFNIPFVRSSKLEEIWKGGFVKINSLTDVKDEFISLYLTKYLTKDLANRQAFARAILRSRNLIDPEPHRINYDTGFMIDESDKLRCLVNGMKSNGSYYEWFSFDYNTGERFKKATAFIKKTDYLKLCKDNSLKSFQSWTQRSNCKLRTQENIGGVSSMA